MQLNFHKTIALQQQMPASVEIVINKQGINAFLCNNFNGIFPFLLFAVFITFGKSFKGEIGSNLGRKPRDAFPVCDCRLSLSSSASDSSWIYS